MLRNPATVKSGTIAVTLIVLACAAAPAAGQGHGKGLAKKNRPAGGSSAAAAAASGSTFTFRQFGSWLDDASLVAPGEAWTAMSLGYYRSSGSNQVDFPVVDAAVGLTKRWQFGASVPYYRVSLADGSNFGGVGDVYLNAKYSIVTPERKRIGLAVTPIVEILDAPAPDGGRFAWAAPVSVEVRRTRYRFFATAGYFSRGALFSSGAVEMAATDRLILTAALIGTRSTNDAPEADALGMSKSRVDISATAARVVTPSIAVFCGTGRTLSHADGEGTSFTLSGGVSFTFAPRLRP